jgi:hypothetical protein
VPYESGENVEQVALVARENATLARFTSEQILETRGFSKSFLHRLKPSKQHHRSDWRRFVLIKLDTPGARDLFSGDIGSATLLIDRHYSSLEPYRRKQPNLYAVNFSGSCLAGYLDFVGESLVLRTRDPRRPLQSVRIAADRSYSQYIIGRICQVGLEV